MRLRLLLAYVGTRYSGWQIQEKVDPPPTIQGALEAALRQITGAAVRVHGAAALMRAYTPTLRWPTATCPENRAPRDWRHSCNAVLPKDIRVLAAAPARPDFHARKDALHKTYVYQFWQERAFVPPALTPFVWNCGPLDLAALHAALPHLLGRRDFAGLRNAGTDVEGTVRTVLDARPGACPALPWYPPHSPMLLFRVTADGFLKQMVRNMAGLLAACGQGKVDPTRIPELLAARDRRAVPSVTAPAAGLALAQVSYETGTLAEGQPQA